MSPTEAGRVPQSPGAQELGTLHAEQAMKQDCGMGTNGAGQGSLRLYCVGAFACAAVLASQASARARLAGQGRKAAGRQAPFSRERSTPRQPHKSLDRGCGGAHSAGAQARRDTRALGRSAYRNARARQRRVVSLQREQAWRIGSGSGILQIRHGTAHAGGRDRMQLRAATAGRQRTRPRSVVCLSGTSGCGHRITADRRLQAPQVRRGPRSLGSAGGCRWGAWSQATGRWCAARTRLLTSAGAAARPWWVRRARPSATLVNTMHQGWRQRKESKARCK